MVFGHGSPLTTIVADVGSGPDELPVVAFLTVERPGDDRLKVGDHLLSVGDVDLRGISHMGYQVAMAEQVRNGKTAEVRAERNGEIVIDYIRARNGNMPWSHIPFVVGFATLALIVILRAPDIQNSRLFFATFMSVAIFQTPIGDGSAFQLILSQFMFLGFGFISLTLVMLFVIAFPRPIVSEDWRRIPNWVAFIPSSFWLIIRLNYYLGGPLLAQDYRVYSFVIDILFFVSVLVILSWNYHCVDPASRRKLRWVLYGVYLAFIPIIMIHVIGTLIPNADAFLWLRGIGVFLYVAIPISMWIAIAHFDLFDVDRVISGTVTYTLLVVVFALMTETQLEPVAANLATQMGLDPGTGQITFVCILAAIALPVQRLVRPHIELLFLPHQHALNKSVEALIEEISQNNDANFEQMTQLIGNCVAESMEPSFCALYVRDQDNWQSTFCSGIDQAPVFTRDQSAAITRFLGRRVMPLRISSATIQDPEHNRVNAIFSDLDVTIVVPFHHHNACRGFLFLGHKRSRDIYTKTDLTLLTAVAMQTSLSYS